MITVYPHDLDDLPVSNIAVHALSLGYSPRITGHDEPTVRLLAELDDPWPPLLVQSQTLRIIDGMHRLLAAQMRGDETIAVRLHDCSDTDAFVLAVSANATHGLPLSLNDRRAAARRIIGSQLEWSDRRIAKASGLSDKTVATIRRSIQLRHDSMEVRRIGRDEHRRPVSSAERRATITQLLSKNPDSSLREIAGRVGVSPETVRSVRSSLRVADAPSAKTPASPVPQEPSVDPQRCLQVLLRDPVLRSTDKGRLLLRVLSTLALLSTDPGGLVEIVPEYDLAALEELAIVNAAAWQSLAELANDRRKEGDSGNAAQAAA